MGFNLFGDAKKSDIRVGYISTDRGYVEGVDLCGANRYAELNPGTTFIIKNRKKIEYKNINEVNQLKPVDVFVPKEPEGECKGIDLEKPYGPPKVEFFGGGGVGVKGNAVVGKDGGILGVHIISGGHGYKYPPIVKIKDGGGQRGGGTVAIAGLGQTAIVKEVYDAEEEFEEYFPSDIKNLCEANENKNDVGYGQRYSPAGKDLGPWDPSMYVNTEEDPIKRQIAQFQEYLAALTDPWWFVRKEAPLNVVSDNEEGFVKRQKKLNFNPNRIVYPVQHWAWGGSQLKHGTVGDKPGSFEDVVFQIYTEGGSGKDLFFTFTEVGGNHTFTVKADDYTDGGEPRSITKHIKPNVDYIVTSDGRYKKKTGTLQGLLRDSFGTRGRKKGLGTSSSIFAEVLGTRNDKDDLQILAKRGIFKTKQLVDRRNQSARLRNRSTAEEGQLVYKLTVPSTKGEVSSSQKAKANNIARSFMNDNAISPVPMSNAPGSDFAGMLFTMEWEEEFPYPGEYTFKGQCDNVASFYLDGQQLMPKIATWKDKPTIVKKHLDWEDSDKKGKVHKMRIDLLNALQYKDVVIQAPDSSTSATDLRGMIKDWYSIRWSGKVASEQEIDDWIGTGKSADDIRKGILGHQAKSAGVSSGIKVQKVFNTVDWMGKANRQLWRTNVYGRGGFVNTAGVCPFDTTKELDTNPYAGTHEIKWRNINFPIDGNYIIKVAVDDSVNLRFHGPGGDVSIRKEGFVNNESSLPTGTSTYTRFFKKGMYTLDAGLEQIPGGRFGFRSDAKGNKIKDKEVSFKVTSSAAFANKITIPGLLSFSKEYKGADINQNVMKMVEVGKEYDVILTSEQQKDKRIKLRIKDGGKRLEMEEYKDNDFTDIVCTVTEGQFYSVQGNRCKFKVGETVKGINPMVLAVDVEVAYATKTVVSAKSWQENPMGVAFTIKAPLPPVPVEEIPKAKGRCPNNPMWTTRFPTSGGARSGASGGASSFDGGLRSNIKEWYKQRWNRVASEKEVDDWIGTGKSSSAIRKGILGHQADIAGVIDDGSGSGSGSSGGRKAVSGGQWYPVRFERWSEFLNRYAVSPVLPLPHPGSAHGGKVFTNTWKIDIPYDGYYQLKGEVDDIARYYIDGDLKLDLSRRTNKIRGRSKFFLSAGLKTLRIEVENYSFVTYKDVSKKIFSARDWRRQAPTAPPPSTGIICHAGGGKGGTDNSEQLVGGKVIVGKGGAGGPGGDDNMYGKHHGGRGGGAGLRNGSHSINTLSHSQIDAMGSGRYKGGPGGFGVNFQGTQVGSIEQTVTKDSNNTYSSGGDGVAMGGGGGGAVRKNSSGRGGHGGSGGVKITWGLTSKSQHWTSPGVYNVTVPGESKQKNSVTIVCIGGGGSGYKDTDGDRQGSGGSGGAYAYVTEEIEAGQKLKIVVGKGGQGKNVKGGENGGDSYVEVVSAPPANETKIIKQKKGEVTYSGPNLFHYTDKRWGKVMNKFGISPANVDTDLDKPASDNVGTKVLEWKNVDFPMKGQYDILFAADNKASLYINGEQLLFADENYTLGSDKSYDKINIGTPGRYDVKIELINSPSANAGSDVFRSNPAGVVLEIRKDVSVAVDNGKPWTTNPVGVSGILVPPPCPKEVGGKGVVTDVTINDPGTGFEDEGPGPDDPQYPVVPVLKKVRPEKPGINYDCSKDQIIMKPDLGYKLKPVCDNFGRIIDVIVTPPPQLTPVPSVPQIWIDSGTGLGCPLIPEFEFVVPPPDILPPEDIIQVTDLAGIKQTGYYNGKPYYGAVYYENGIKYAGWYATAGQPIQIYDTLQESIDATVTTPPSAIQRQGSDVTSNDPRLNIPGTPENLT